MTETKLKVRGLTAETVNLVIAGCAILISAASFYATYLQANAAEKQVKAMTLPLIQFTHGNHSPERNQLAVGFSLKNQGVGAAIIKSVELSYRGKSFDDVYGFFEACCRNEYAAYRDHEASMAADEFSSLDGNMTTQPLTEVILPGQSNYKFFELFFHKSTGKFWEKLNQERWELELNVCYCSLLDDCFLTKDSSVITEVVSCSIN